MSLVLDCHETIIAGAQKLRAGSTTCVEILERCLQRIDQCDAAVRAWVLVDRDRALREARTRDQERADGCLRGPLHGIPIGIKDIIDVAGWPTVAGAREPVVTKAPNDAPVVARLRQAGAVILGKTVTTQFACFDPAETHNPWDPDHTPGGSSSGSAAAVACGMCLGALGSQTGGSIIRPASFCGVCGLKPTYAALPTDGIVPVAESLDHVGPIAATVSDLMLLFEALAGDRSDRASELTQSIDEGSELGHAATAVKPAERQPCAPRLGRLEGIFSQRAESETWTDFTAAVTRLSAAGARVSVADLPMDFAEVLERHRTIMAAEAAHVHRQAFLKDREPYQPRIAELISRGLDLSAVDYIDCRRHQVRLAASLARVWDRYEALLSPSTPGPAPDLSTTGDPVFNSPWSYCGVPTVTIPIGLAAKGLPLGLQLIGPADCDRELLRIAAWCERALQENRESS